MGVRNELKSWNWWEVGILLHIFLSPECTVLTVANSLTQQGYTLMSPEGWCVCLHLCACVLSAHFNLTSPLLTDAGFLSYVSRALFTFSPSVNPEKVVFIILFLFVKYGGAHT